MPSYANKVKNNPSTQAEGYTWFGLRVRARLKKKKQNLQPTSDFLCVNNLDPQ